LIENPEGKRPFEEPDGGGIILKPILKKWGVDQFQVA
jgi:hypothetical protein